jgi:hypothetical protein
LQLDETALLFNHQQRLESRQKLLDDLRLERKRHPQLEDADPRLRQRLRIEGHVAQRGLHVVVGFAGCDDPDAVLLVPRNDAVEAVRAREGPGRRQPGRVELALGVERGRDDQQRVQAAVPNRRLRFDDGPAARRKLDHAAAVAYVRCELEPAPETGEA